MSGTHDLGGQSSFGPVVAEADEPVFHSDWERRVFAINVAAGGPLGSIDYRRHGIERMPADAYLRSSYYEKWLARVELLAVERGLLSRAELETGTAEATAAHRPATPEEIDRVIARGRPATRTSGRQAPVFAVGDRVRARDIATEGHTRLPGYARGRIGRIRAVHGTHVFPDTNAHDRGENPQPLYNVEFAATVLFGAGAGARDRVLIDLWEDHLEAVDE